jgi:Uma2 family endonuclease
MSIAPKEEYTTFTFKDYLEWESKNEIKHEYFAGEVFPMAGASDAHDLVCVNILSAIHQHLRGKPCRVYSSDMKLKVAFKHADASYYPDMMVVCDSEDKQPVFKTRPKVIVEVMSDFRRDNVEKFMVYQMIESLEEYIVIDQDPEEKRAWIYRKETGWDMELIEKEGVLKIPSIDFSIPLSEMYLA